MCLLHVIKCMFTVHVLFVLCVPCIVYIYFFNWAVELGQFCWGAKALWTVLMIFPETVALVIN